jgi:hypothetical protein
MRRRSLSGFLLVLGLTACQDGGPTDPEERFQPANAVLGRVAFTEECASCHASADGLDLAFFGFSDTTIIRRALAHVDATTARHIVAHIRTLPASGVNRDVRLFQPGGRVLTSDVEFATSLFGSDAWPLSLTTAQLRAIDPRAIAVAVAMPLWSEEKQNLDWMPDRPLPEGILKFRDAAAQGAIAAYRAAPTVQNLNRAISALRTADRSVDNPAAPCILDEPARLDHAACFEVRRWTSTLLAAHLIRFGLDTPIPSALRDIWWDVGNIVRRSGDNGKPGLENRRTNWASWMYVSWMFDPSRHQAVYTGRGFQQLGLPRHATFIALRMQVARRAGSHGPYEDLRQAVIFAPAEWTTAVATFGYRHLLERIAAGDLPTNQSGDLARARARIQETAADLAKKAPPAERPALAALAQQVLAALPPLP